MDLTLTVVSFAVGVFIGLTGMGAGALLTPILVLFFGMPPSVAVSSDLAAAAVTKPVAGLVHLRNRTVDLRIVGWLTLGSVPAACTGVFLLYRYSPGAGTEVVIRVALGSAAECGCACRKCHPCRSRGTVVLVEDAA